MMKLVIFALLAVGINCGQVSQQLLSAPLGRPLLGSYSLAAPAFGSVVSGPKALLSAAPALASYQSALLPASGYSYSAAAAPALATGYTLPSAGLVAAAPAAYQTTYAAAAAPALQTTYAAAAAPALQTSYLAAAAPAYQAGYVAAHAPAYQSGYVAAAPAYQAGYVAAAPAYQASYVAAAPQKLFHHSPVHHVQTVHQPHLKQVTYVTKPQQQVTRVLPAHVTESQRVFALPPPPATGVVPVGHGHKRTVENRVVLEQHKISPVDEDLAPGAGDLAPGNEAALQPAPAPAPSAPASAPGFLSQEKLHK